MAESANASPGPDSAKSKHAVLTTLKEADVPAMTAGDIADKVEFSRRTVHSRLKDLAASGRVQSAKIGGSTAYWVEDTTPPELATSGGFIRDQLDGFLRHTSNDQIDLANYEEKSLYAFILLLVATPGLFIGGLLLSGWVSAVAFGLAIITTMIGTGIAIKVSEARDADVVTEDG